MKKSIYILFLLTIINCQLSFAQKQGQAYIDSLLKELPKSKEDTNKVNLLYNLSFEYYSVNPDEGIKYGKIGLKLAEKLNWKKGIANVSNSIGTCNYAKSNYPKALEFYFISLKINEELNNRKAIAASLNNIGMIYRNQSDYPKALEYYFKALKINEELKNKNFIARNLGNIGIIYREQSDNPKALEYNFKALKIFEELNDKSGIASDLGNIGIIYESQSDYPRALEYYFKALKINEELNDKNGISVILGNIGGIYQYQSDYPKALEFYFKALKINEELHDKRGIAVDLSCIGDFYIKLSQDTIYDKIQERNEFVGLSKEINLKKGIEYSLIAEKISKEINELNLLKLISQNLYDGYKRQGNYLKALEYHEQYKTMWDSVFNMEKAKKFATLEAIRDKELAEKQIVIKQLEIDKQKSKQLLMLIGIGSMLFIIFGLGFLLIKLKKQKKLSDWLLHNILPKSIAERLMKKEHPIADSFDSASIVFIDIVDFTKSSAGAEPKKVAQVLNALYSKLDKIAQKYGLEKIKTIGDCYMAAAGIPVKDPENAIKTALFALEAMNLLKNYDTGDGTILNFRFGVDCGPVVAGVIGDHKFIYDVWGDTVNTAARMEEYSEPGRIQVSERFKDKIVGTRLDLSLKERGEIEIKGKGMMKTYFLESVIC